MPKTLDDLGQFKGPKKLVEVYLNATSDLNKSYVNGLSFCLAGTHGAGKSTTCANILKKASQKNFTTLFTNLNDVVSALTIAPSEEKYLARKELTEVDFLVVDEFDSRHLSNSDNAIDLFGRTLEYVIRARLQNKLPIILVSNSPNPVETFTGALKESIQSLMTKLPLIPILGQDIRKLQGNNV
jgi:DNA replication protein DnaC